MVSRLTYLNHLIKSLWRRCSTTVHRRASRTGYCLPSHVGRSVGFESLITSIRNSKFRVARCSHVWITSSRFLRFFAKRNRSCRILGS